MTISYNLNIPASTNNPSVDQPDMQTNTNAINQLIGIDHISFNTSGGGQHKQVTFNDNIAPSAPTGSSSVEYTRAGTADPTTNQLIWQNAQGTFPLSTVRAYGTFSITAGVITTVNQFNISSSSALSTTQFQFTLTSNVVFGNSPGILISLNQGTYVYSFAANVLTITVANVASPTRLTFMVLQL